MNKIIHQTIAGGAELVNMDMNDFFQTLRGADYVDLLCFDLADMKKIRPMKDAKSALVHISCPKNVSLEEINAISESLTKNLHEDAMVLWGATIDKKAKNLSIIAVIGRNRKTKKKAGEKTGKKKR